MNSIILIGMPGAGKSTIGVILAKAMNLEFCDTDLIIQKAENMLLQNIIDIKGEDYFKACEEKHILAHNYNNMVVATGGSAVYSPSAMKHLKSFGRAVYLDVSVCELKKRIGNFSSRGVIGNGSVEDIFNERIHLYKKYSDISVNCDKLNMEQAVTIILKEITCI